ncbi:MAG: REP-associated tyrosine transposase [Opitutaceae bacterium]
MYPIRPPRIQLFQGVRPFYFITFNTAQRKPQLATMNFHQVFKEFAMTAYQKYQVSVGQYVIMPDHIHLFVSVPDHGVTLQAWIKSLKSTLTQHLKSEGYHPPIWQQGFFDHVIRNADSYSEKWHYVRLNPVRANLVEKPEDWPYSGEIVRLEY